MSHIGALGPRFDAPYMVEIRPAEPFSEAEWTTLCLWAGDVATQLGDAPKRGVACARGSVIAWTPSDKFRQFADSIAQAAGLAIGRPFDYTLSWDPPRRARPS